MNSVKFINHFYHFFVITVLTEINTNQSEVAIAIAIAIAIALAMAAVFTKKLVPRLMINLVLVVGLVLLVQ